jgi:hypothetical protein
LKGDSGGDSYVKPHFMELEAVAPHERSGFEVDEQQTQMLQESVIADAISTIQMQQPKRRRSTVVSETASQQSYI